MMTNIIEGHHLFSENQPAAIRGPKPPLSTLN